MSIYIGSSAELPKMRLYHWDYQQIDKPTVKTIPFFGLFHVCCLIDVLNNIDIYECHLFSYVSTWPIISKCSDILQKGEEMT